MTFAEKLAHLRKATGMTQDELAQKLNLSRQAVYKWENEQSMPDIDNLKLLASTFSVTIDQLVNDDQTLPALTAAETAIAEAPSAPPYGKVRRTSLNPGSVNADEDSLRKLLAEHRQLVARRVLLWASGLLAIACGAVAVITLFVFLVQTQNGTSQTTVNSTLTVLLIFFFLGLALAAAWGCFEKWLYRTTLTSRAYFFLVKKRSEKYLKEKRYYFQMLQSDLLAWFFFDPVKKLFGFYFKGAEQFVCPIQNYFSISYKSGGRGIRQGTPETQIGGIFGAETGFFITETPTFTYSEDTFFTFTLRYFNEFGKSMMYSYVLDSVRTYTIDMADGDAGIHYALQNAISKSTIEAFEKIKNKLDYEKKKIGVPPARNEDDM